MSTFSHAYWPFLHILLYVAHTLGFFMKSKALWGSQMKALDLLKPFHLSFQLYFPQSVWSVLSLPKCFLLLLLLLMDFKGLPAASATLDLASNLWGGRVSEQ